MATPRTRQKPAVHTRASRHYSLPIAERRRPLGTTCVTRLYRALARTSAGRASATLPTKYHQSLFRFLLPLSCHHGKRPPAQSEPRAARQPSHTHAAGERMLNQAASARTVESLPSHLATATAMNSVKRLRSLPASAAHRRCVPFRAANTLEPTKTLRAVFHVRRFVHLLVAHFPSPALSIRTIHWVCRIDADPHVDIKPSRQTIHATRSVCDVTGVVRAIHVPSAPALRENIRNRWMRHDLRAKEFLGWPFRRFAESH